MNTERKTVPIEEYDAALFTVGVLSSALNVALLSLVKGDRVDRMEHRRAALTSGQFQFESYSAEAQDALIADVLFPAVVVHRLKNGRFSEF